MRSALVIALSLALAGCVSARYDPATGKVSYYRFGATKAESVTVTTSTGTTVEVSGYGSDGSAVAEGIARGIASGLKP